MSLYIVGPNRLLWRRLYRIAETRYSLTWPARRDTREVRFRIVDGYRPPFDGQVVARRRGLSWRRQWSLRWWTLPWTAVHSCTLDRDRGVEVASHTIRLLVFHDDGCLDIAGRGPLGALSLAALREAIQRATQP